MEEPGGLQSMGSQSQTRLSDFTFFLSNFLTLSDPLFTQLKAVVIMFPNFRTHLCGTTNKSMEEKVEESNDPICHCEKCL